jgi:hypothetical protein
MLSMDADVSATNHTIASGANIPQLAVGARAARLGRPFPPRASDVVQGTVRLAHGRH